MTRERQKTLALVAMSAMQALTPAFGIGFWLHPAPQPAWQGLLVILFVFVALTAVLYPFNRLFMNALYGPVN